MTLVKGSPIKGRVPPKRRRAGKEKKHLSYKKNIPFFRFLARLRRISTSLPVRAARRQVTHQVQGFCGQAQCLNHGFFRLGRITASLPLLRNLS